MALTPSPPPGASSSTPPTLRERIARLLVVGFRGLEARDAPWVERAIEDGLGGVILFDTDGRKGGARNVASPEQVAALTSGLRALAADRELIVAIDQEGGKVVRLGPEHGYPALESEAAIGGQPEAAVRAWADGLARTLADAGVNLNLAPVVDLNVNPDNPSVGAIGRAFSADPVVVARDAALEIAAHHTHGVRTALKHFPGLGSATANTDLGVADVTDTWTDTELRPYRELLRLGLVDVVMAANVVNGQLDPHAPASLSAKTVTNLLRGELGFDGVVITDDLQAGAITDAFGFDDAILLAVEAGCDLLLLANQAVYRPDAVDEAIDVIEAAIGQGRVSEARIDQSIERLNRLFTRG